MPYCPKCDMDFVDGITVCSDCGSPLADSREETPIPQPSPESDPPESWLPPETEDFETDEGPSEERQQPLFAPSHVYRKKSQQYDDLKSSASAFYLVGGFILLLSILFWSNVFPLPFTGFSRLLSQTVMTVLGIGALLIAVNSSRSAKQIHSQIPEEENFIRQLIEWFAASYSKEDLDHKIAPEPGRFSAEEMGLKRFELIQDILITSHDITDQAYIDMLAEEIYEKIYEVS